MLTIGPKDFTSEQAAHINACKEQINELTIKETQIWNDLLFDKLKCYSVTDDTVLSERERDFLWDYIFNDTCRNDAADVSTLIQPLAEQREMLS